MMAEKSVKTILIVGGGLAGVSVALEIASQNSAKIILIESQKSTGGNSAKAVSGINGCMTTAQERREIQGKLLYTYSELCVHFDTHCPGEERELEKSYPAKSQS
uniref:FAD-dependent oxidoreductase 2 FAD binding domain-containing protein n=1 Tax=Romanomermis culicivorax TaxID=13658 RepID=A0A915HHY8_ROMCU